MQQHTARKHDEQEPLNYYTIGKASLVDEVVTCAIFLLVCGWVLVGPAVLVTMAYLGWTGRHWGTAALALLISSIFWPVNEWPAYRRSRVWTMCARYFQLSVVTPPLPYLEPDKRYVFAMWPHGVFPFGSMLGMLAATGPATGLPEDAAGLATSVVFWTGIMRHLVGWTGLYPAHKDVMLRLLQTRSVGIVPEGLAGMFLESSSTEERIFGATRKGFVKIAIRAGADIVPVYILGQTELLTLKGWTRISRTTRFPFAVYWGRFGLPIPRKVHLTALIGTPISVGRLNLCPSQQEVDELHAVVMGAVRDLFDAHKHLKLGYGNKQLVIC